MLSTLTTRPDCRANFERLFDITTASLCAGPAHDTILGSEPVRRSHLRGPCSDEANGALRALQGYSEGRSGIHE